jgi:chemosensory pili system protein ChpA (sensor histidine kinase/response regulator)
MNPHCTTNNELSMHEAAELLAEVCLETKSLPQSNLFDFAGLLRELICLYEDQGKLNSEGKLNSDDELKPLFEFISKGIAEVRVAMDADLPSLEQIELLYDQAIDGWGEQLVAIRERSDSSADPGWEFTAESSSEVAPAEAQIDTEVLQAPSADAIHALLSQLSADQSAEVTRTQVAPKVVAPVDVTTELRTQKPMAPVQQQEFDSNPVIGVESLDPELREAFMDDASGCLSSIESSLLRLETNRRDTEALGQVLRELHTLKGASGSVGLTMLADQIHHLEDSLRDDQEAGNETSIDNLLSHVDRIRAQVSGASSNPPPAQEAKTADHLKVEAQPQATTNPVFSDDDSDDELVRVKSSQLNRLMDMLVELVMLRNQRETELTELQDVHHELINSVSKMRLLSNESESRVDSSKSLQLSEVASDVLEAAQHLRNCTRPFADGNAAVSRFIRQFRQELVALRRTPIAGLFRRLERVVRDAARAESKQVRLVLLGEDTGIERSLQQRLYEPLLHIVRNSVCHGIESVDERSQCGKAGEGVISLEAKSGPNLCIIEIRDDGRGLDYEAIRRRGIERGLLTADQVVSRDELSQLIFHPGFSTRDSANQIGGRGVGMDVVAATMQRMRGWFEVVSEPGRGTRIRLSFPLPSVIQHAMVFRCANQLFALPMETVQAAGEVPADLPRANFSQLLGLDMAQTTESNHAIVVADEQNVSMSGKASPLALFVDEIVGPEELVVRPLPSLLKHHPFCAGATLSGMGQSVLLLDARRVLRAQSPLANALQLSHRGAVASGKSPAVRRSRVLVVDDSLSARKRVVRSLNRYPLEIVEASDGKEALELLKSGGFAAIFSDMEMPNVDGMELLAQVNSSDRSDSPPVVIISSRSESEFTERAQQLGAAGYLIKPLADGALDAAMLKLAPLRHLVSDSTSNQPERQS